jgi:hypothetical protein
VRPLLLPALHNSCLNAMRRLSDMIFHLALPLACLSE